MQPDTIRILLDTFKRSNNQTVCQKDDSYDIRLVKYGSRRYFSTGENQSYTQRSLLANSAVVQLTGLPTNEVS